MQISDNSRPSWVTHLNGFQNLIRTRKERPGRSCHSQDLASFFNRYFAFHLVLARTAFRLTPPSSHISPLLPDSILEKSDTIDPYMGLSPALLLMIDQVAELAWACEDGNIKINRKDAHQLKTDLDSLQQKIPTENIDPNMECAAIAEANRLGALLLLHEICSSKAPINRSGIPTVESEEKNVYVERILTLMLEKKVNMMRTAVTPLWPLFLAGCCARREEERVTVLQLFKELEDIRRFGVCIFFYLFPCWLANIALFLRTLPLRLKLSKWSGASGICRYKMKEDSRKSSVHSERKIPCKKPGSRGSMPWSCWVGGSSA